MPLTVPKELFGCTYANVQPHSGAQANMAVFFAMLKPGDTVMGMNLAHGGHLTHGSPANFSGAYFNIVPYGVNDDGVIDYEEVRRIANECHPKLIVASASAYARIIDFKKFREIADEVGAYLMVDMAHIAGLVAGGQHPSPIPYADVTTTTTHKTLRGPRGGLILSSEETAKKFNFNKAIFPGIQGGPLMHVIAAKAVCFKEALSDDFKIYAQGVIDNAQALCSGLTKRGIRIVSGKTENHLMLVDLTNLGKTGKEAENLLDEVNITCNKKYHTKRSEIRFCDERCPTWNGSCHLKRHEYRRHGCDRRSDRHRTERGRKCCKTGKSSGERSDGEISADLKNRIKYPKGSCICRSLF